MAFPGRTMRNPTTGLVLEFVHTAVSTNGELLEVLATYPPGSPEPPAHFHPNQEEHFTILEGEMTVRMHGNLRVLQAGDTLHIPATEIHSMWNHSTVSARVQWQTRPALRTEHFMETFAGFAIDGKANQSDRPSLLQSILTIHHFSCEFRLANPSSVVQAVMFALLVPFARALGKKPVYVKHIN